MKILKISEINDIKNYIKCNKKSREKINKINFVYDKSYNNENKFSISPIDFFEVFEYDKSYPYKFLKSLKEKNINIKRFEERYFTNYECFIEWSNDHPGTSLRQKEFNKLAHLLFSFLKENEEKISKLSNVFTIDEFLNQ